MVKNNKLAANIDNAKELAARFLATESKHILVTFPELGVYVLDTDSDISNVNDHAARKKQTVVIVKENGVFVWDKYVKKTDEPKAAKVKK